MSINVNDLQSKKTRLIGDAQFLLNEHGPASGEYRAKVDEIDTLQKLIDAGTRAGLDKLPEPVATPPVSTPAPAVVITRQDESKRERRAKLNEAWRSYLQGRYDDKIQEHRDILSTQVNGGGAVVPEEFSGFLSQTLKLYASLFDYANVRQSPNGRSVKIPKVTDTSNGLTLITEGSVSLTETDPTYSSSIVNTDLFSSGVIRFSNELLADSYFDLERMLSDLSSIRVGRGIERLLTTATDQNGTATPNNPGLLSIAQVATTTASIAGFVGWSDITSTYNALDAAYLPKAIWQMSSQTRNALTQLRDSTGRPFFTPSTDGGMDYLLGKPIVINQSLATPTAGVFAANAKPILFGSLYDGLQVVSSEVRVQTLVERFADKYESAIIVSTRIGSASLQANSLQALQIAAS